MEKSRSENQSAWDGTLRLGLLLVMVLEIPMTVVMFGNLTFHHETLIKEVTVGIGFVGFILMCFLFVRTAARVL
jgi:hypothetical protein